MQRYVGPGSTSLLVAFALTAATAGCGGAATDSAAALGHAGTGRLQASNGSPRGAIDDTIPVQKP